MRNRFKAVTAWLGPLTSSPHWFILLGIGMFLLIIALAEPIGTLYREGLANRGIAAIVLLQPLPATLRALLAGAAGVALIYVAVAKLRQPARSSVSLSVRPHRPALATEQHQRALKVVAIGGGTGLPSVLRGMKHLTGHLTAIVTVADNGGSSGRLRRDMGILPPGDLRNNIAALADDEDLMTQLFQYRFSAGDLDGHSFGNLFITALSDITGSMEQALQETERVLAVQGSVLPATLDDITLCGEIWHPADNTLQQITGESQITELGGRIERVYLQPQHARAYPRSVQAILAADLVVIGPGSLYTSILPTLLVRGITEAIRASKALCVYVCNVATQPGETDGFTVAEHVLALEKHVGPHLFQVVVANNHFPLENAGENTHYVMPADAHHEICQRYRIIYADLTDSRYPWRHDPAKLADVLSTSYTNYQASLQQVA